MATKVKKDDKRLNNQFWKHAPSTGRKPIYENPIALETACYEYFESTLLRKIGKSKNTPPFTLAGLCVFLGITDDTWRNYKQKKDFLGVIRHVEQIIYVNKFEGAAVGMYNANIISRDLGLHEKKSNLPSEIIVRPILEGGKKLPDDD